MDILRLWGICGINACNLSVPVFLLQFVHLESTQLKVWAQDHSFNSVVSSTEYIKDHCRNAHVSNYVLIKVVQKHQNTPVCSRILLTSRSGPLNLNSFAEPQKRTKGPGPMLHSTGLRKRFPSSAPKPLFGYSSPGLLTKTNRSRTTVSIQLETTVSLQWSLTRRQFRRLGSYFFTQWLPAARTIYWLHATVVKEWFRATKTNSGSKPLIRFEVQGPLCEYGGCERLFCIGGSEPLVCFDVPGSLCQYSSSEPLLDFYSSEPRLDFSAL